MKVPAANQPFYRAQWGDVWEYSWSCDSCGARTYERHICAKCELEPSQAEVDLERRGLDVAERVRALK